MPPLDSVGDGPWQICNVIDRSYRTTSDADPRHLYHDVVVAIDPARELNNGQPSSLARWLAALEPAPGQHLLHVRSSSRGMPRPTR